MPPSRKPAAFRLLADENISLPLIKRLRKAGINVFLTPKGLKNGQVVRLAGSHSMVLLTHDRDFSDIGRYPPEKTPGIIVAAIHPPNDDVLLKALMNLFRGLSPASFNGKLVLLTEEKFLIK